MSNESEDNPLFQDQEPGNHYNSSKAKFTTIMHLSNQLSSTGLTTKTLAMSYLEVSMIIDMEMLDTSHQETINESKMLF